MQNCTAGRLHSRAAPGNHRAMTQTSAPGLRLDRYGPVARLLIDRADKRNAMDQAMWAALPALIAAAVADPAVRVLVLQSAEPGLFCAGADIAEMAARRTDGAWLAANQAAINRAQFELARAALPTVAFIDGDCIGGGCGLALACDIRVSSPRGRFGVTPARLGLTYPLHDTKLLVDLVGPGQAKRLLFTAGLIDAAEALRIGLVEIVADSAHEVIAQIARTSPASHRGNKGFVRRLLDGQTADDAETLAAFAAAFAGPDFAEGTAAFLEKRAAEFGG